MSPARRSSAAPLLLRAAMGVALVAGAGSLTLGIAMVGPNLGAQVLPAGQPEAGLPMPPDMAVRPAAQLR